MSDTIAGDSISPSPERFLADAAPRLHPLSYPGAWPGQSALVGASRIWEILDRDGGRLSWTGPGDRLSACRVRVDPETLAWLELTRGVAPHLTSVLEELNVPNMDARIPVIAVGSNAAPAQLRHKFADTGATLLIPSVRARVTGVRVGFAAFVAPYGAVPATPYPADGAESELFVQWLDPAQLAELDASESPFYRRVWLDGDAGVGVLLESGERLAGAYAYVATGGVLGDEAGPWIMATPDGPAAGEESRWCATQADLVVRLQRHPGLDAFGERVDDFPRLARDVPDRARELLRDAGLAHPPTAFERLPDTMGAPPRRYRSLLPAAPAELDGVATAVVTGTADRITRHAQSVVRLDPDLWDELGHPGSVEIVSARLLDRLGDQAPRALAVVVPERRGDAPGPERGSRRIEVDHVLRMAVGLQLGETAAMVPARVRRPRWPDAILGRPNSLVLRVTLADPSSAERDVCLMSSLSLALLGIASGDHVVLEGAPDESGEVRAMTLKAFETPDVVAAERARISGGTWGARFPGARDTLGVAPDIPTIFLDSATRDRLGLGARQLTTVRARPARVQQFGNELREILLVLAVALIGIIGLLTTDPIVTTTLLALFVAGTFLLVLSRLRRRLSHDSVLHRRRRPSR